MSQSLVSCPLCCQPTFCSTNALCLSLINIVSKCLNCPLCEEVLRGLDKLTIHLLSHLLTQTTTNNNGYNFLCQDNKCNNFSSLVKPLESNSRQYAVQNTVQDNNCSVADNTIISFDKGGPPGLIVDDQVMLLFHNPLSNKNHSINNSEVTSKGEQCVAGTSNTCNLPQAATSSQTIDIPSTQSNKLTDDKGYSKQPSDNLYKTEQVVTKFNNPNDSVIQHHASCILDTANNPTSGSFNNDENRTEFRDSRLDKDAWFLDKNDMFSDFEKFYINWKHKGKFLKSESPKKGEEVAVSKPLNYCNNIIMKTIHTAETADQGSTKLVAEAEKTTKVFCNVCSLCFSDSAALSVHESIAHSGAYASEDANKKLYACQLCSKAFKMRGSLMVHTRVAHSPGSVAAIAKLVEAKQEGDSVTSSSSPGSAPGSPQFNCSTCGKTFKKEYHLVQHEKIHEGKQWECDICFKSFTTKYFLKKHKRLHTGEMPYMCTICNKSFTFQQSYHKHLLYHNDDKPYSCCDCGRAFKELSTLHNHQRIHTGEKPFSCEHCGKCFRQRVSYLVHRRIHTGVMPYKCLECNKSFRYKVSERTHKCIGQAGSVKPSSELKDLPYNQAGTERSVSISSTQSPHTSKSGSTTSTNQDTSSIYNVNTSENNKDSKRILWKNSEVISLPDTTDFFSLVMSPSTSEKLQKLTLSADNDNSKCDNNCISQETSSDHMMESVNVEESLKDLLYSVSDYQ